MLIQAFQEQDYIEGIEFQVATILIIPKIGNGMKTQKATHRRKMFQRTIFM